jgi:hypothetical protein
VEIIRAPGHVQYSRKLTDVPLGEGIPSAEELKDELIAYTDVLLGRVPPPVDSPYLDLMEVASAYYARALEIEMLIFNQEHDPTSPVIRGHPLNKFRTGQLRSFIEMAKRLADLGSRRLTQEQLLQEARYDAGDNYD